MYCDKHGVFEPGTGNCPWCEGEKSEASSGNSDLLYAKRDVEALDKAGNYFCKHVSALTSEGLHRKVDIAAELGWRDWLIAKCEAEHEALMDEIRRLRRLEDSYDTEEEVMGEIFLALNRLCGI